MTLYITDLDGTLVNSSHFIDDESIEIINSLVEQGIAITYATARSLETAREVTRGLKLRIPAVLLNGAFIMDTVGGEVLRSCLFTAEEMGHIKCLMKRHDFYPHMTVRIDGKERVHYHPEKLNEGKRFYLKSHETDARLTPVTDFDAIFNGEGIVCVLIGDREELEPVYLDLVQDTRFYCAFQQELYREEYWLEIFPAAATKAAGVLALKQMGGYDRVICFGDAINDLSMFKVCDESYAMSIAVPEVKSAATAVIGSNDENSVARWLKSNAVK